MANIGKPVRKIRIEPEPSRQPRREEAPARPKEPRREPVPVPKKAGRAGGFGGVIGVDRGDNRKGLEDAGADVVVGDLGEVVVGSLTRWPRD